jgi:hypothetical protein
MIDFFFIKHELPIVVTRYLNLNVQGARNSLDGQEDFLLEVKESSRFPSWDQNKQRRLKLGVSVRE